MAGDSSNAPKPRKRVEAETASLKRAKNGSAFTRCEECNKDVPVVLIDMHSCSLDSKIKMTLEAQVVESAVEAKKPAAKKKATSPGSKEKGSGSKGKKAKDPNAPKRPVASFFLFMEDFRKEYSEANPGAKKGSAVAKEGGEKWKLMTDEEKKVYVDKAAVLKEEYEKAMEKYNAENGENGENAENEDNDENVETAENEDDDGKAEDTKHELEDDDC